jgi:hypothetical protein
MPRVFDYRILLFGGVGALVTAPCYYLVGRSVQAGGSIYEMYLTTFVAVAALLAGYELFFAIQATNLKRHARVVHSSLDSLVPFVVQWVWIYGLIYYALLGLPLAFFSRIGQSLTFIAGGLVILLLSSPVYLLWPTTCPTEWRRFEITGTSSRFLSFIQSLDQGRNSCPSMHCTLAAYAATFVPSHTLLVAIPALICLSCIFVKQHSVVDLPVSLVFGYVSGSVVHQIV